jgi:mRNA interferase RelE/StbE
MWNIHWSRAAERDFRRLPPATRSRIIAAIERLAENPEIVDIRPLVGEGDLWRLRVGDYRVLFLFEPLENAIIIAPFSHRRDAYR